MWERAKIIFLVRSGRSSCAPFPGPRALSSEVMLAAWFLFCGRFFVLAIGPQRQTPPCRGRERERERGRVGEGKNIVWLAVGARATPRPQGHAHCLRWCSRGGGFLFVFRFWSRPLGPSGRGERRGRLLLFYWRRGSLSPPGPRGGLHRASARWV